MPEETATLKAGNRAPEFDLAAANRAEHFTLQSAGGPVVLEFLRGTW